jgi:hypothetical protein
VKHRRRHVNQITLKIICHAYQAFSDLENPARSRNKNE